MTGQVQWGGSSLLRPRTYIVLNVCTQRSKFRLEPISLIFYGVVNRFYGSICQKWVRSYKQYLGKMQWDISCRRIIVSKTCKRNYIIYCIFRSTDYGRPERKQPSLHGRKFTPTPKSLGTAEAYFVCHIGPIFQIFMPSLGVGSP